MSEKTNPFAFEMDKLESSMPSFLKTLAEDYEFFIAGGAITSIFTNTPINDFDVYVKKEEDLIDVISRLSTAGNVVSITNKSILCGCDGQLINVVFMKAFPTADVIFDSFDFTCVMGAYDVANGEFILHDNFLKHNSQRMLQYNENTAFPIFSLLRVKKYMDKRYSISKNEYIRMILNCLTLEITTYEQLAEHIGGLYGIDVSEIMDTTKEFNLKDVIKSISELKSDFDSPKYHDLGMSTRDVNKKILELRLSDKKDKVGYIEHGKNYILIFDDVLLCEVDEDFVLKNDISEYQGLFKAYKYIKKTDEGDYVSFNDTSYVYQKGETLTPKSVSHGLFCGALNEKHNFTYSKSNGGTLIELLVKASDIRAIQHSDTFKGISNLEVNKFIFTKIVE